MRFLIDNDVPAVVARILRRAGFDVTEMRAVLPANAADEDLVNYATREAMILVTCNRNDFLGLAVRLPHSGLIILIRRRSRPAEAGALLALIRRAGESGLARKRKFRVSGGSGLLQRQIDAPPRAAHERGMARLP